MKPMRVFALDSRRMGRPLASWQQQQQRMLPATRRACSSLSDRLYRDLTSRQLPLTFDYIHPQSSYLLSLTLADLLPTLTPAPNELPSARSTSRMPAGHHLVYFPPQVTLSQLLPDGTDTLHAPGSPFNRRLWAGGSVRFATSNALTLNGSRAVCIETIRDVIVKGRPGEEKVLVRIERRIGAAPEGEDNRSIRERIWRETEGETGQASVIENRSLVFMREKTPEQLNHDKASFDMETRAIRCKLGLAATGIEYRNIAPLYVEEELTVCGKPKPGRGHAAWDVWIEGKDGRLAVRGTAKTSPATLTALTFLQSVLVHGGLLSGYYVLFLPHLVFKTIPEIWRLFSPFMITGPGLSLIFDLYFSMVLRCRLETGSPRFSAPGEFFTYVFFVAFTITVSSLILAFVYTYSQDNRGKKASFFIVQIPVEFLPWAMLTLTLVISGWPSALSDGMGIIAAHLYDFLTRIYPTFGGGKNCLATPAFVRRFFAAHTPRREARAFGTAYHHANDQARNSSIGWTSSFQSSWNRRGPGRRLGGG
ncbi:DER1-domain-containing protein [Aspergillus sclerotioniger CBS 115572]|uniref:DER1-domain-containing protein n=1 Tax=Aspergillus sclerotioniger CBS 115572 TaxID=1450535 RepID=A0A317WJ49_9EURO|nr:DER1-domain-containing protein [Aspergillus sclerotioniger CBS 115572]PWY85671.1 DER1-domain-containing protein [Aspergillus sclerotioniger CBS 115572]